MKLSSNAKNAIMIGVMCSVSYLAVYIARNVLGVVTPTLIKDNIFSEEFLGTLSSLYFIFYAVGQLINGFLGQKIKASWMISAGLLLAGVSNYVFSKVVASLTASMVAYAMTGFFLAMIYAPMTRLVSENTEPIHAVRCSVGYTFASFFGSPVAGILAAALAWQSVFILSSAMLALMAVLCFVLFFILERKKVIKYNVYNHEKAPIKDGVKVLIKHSIIKFALVSMITGVVRTAVVFWLPTYFQQYLGYSESQASLVFSISTFVMATTTFITIFIYERLKRNMDKTLLIMFITSFIFFLLVFLLKHPILNIIFIVLAVMASNGAATMIWSVYCPSLRDTGMVSGATGFLDCLSYVGAAISSAVFGNAVNTIGWGNLILIWLGLMVVGIIVALPYKAFKKS